MKQLLTVFGLLGVPCTPKNGIKIAKYLVLHQHKKQIDLHMHSIRNLIHDHVLEMLYCPTDNQVADIFTKSITEVKFSKIQSMLGVQECVIKGGYALMPHSFS